jgi:hypothetical protein
MEGLKILPLSMDISVFTSEARIHPRAKCEEAAY